MINIMTMVLLHYFKLVMPWKKLTQHYGAPSSTLEQSFEYQNYDLVNSERKHGLNTLSYSKNVQYDEEIIVKTW